MRALEETTRGREETLPQSVVKVLEEETEHQDLVGCKGHQTIPQGIIETQETGIDRGREKSTGRRSRIKGRLREKEEESLGRPVRATLHQEHGTEGEGKSKAEGWREGQQQREDHLLEEE